MSTLPPVRDGHFVLESGLHTDRWFDLDGLFVDGAAVAPHVERLADAIRAFAPTAVCGPLDGGAFLAQALARHAAWPFLYSRRVTTGETAGLFEARYALSARQQAFARGRRIALVDDMISAGSSTRATLAALDDAGATTVVVATLFLSGTVGERFFVDRDIPVVAGERVAIALWSPDACPLCRQGTPTTSPTD